MRDEQGHHAWERLAASGEHGTCLDPKNPGYLPIPPVGELEQRVTELERVVKILWAAHRGEQGYS